MFREQQGDDRLARETYLKARELDPRSAFVHHRLAAVSDRLGDFQTAEYYYRLALEGAPTDPDLLNDLGYSYYLSGRLSAADAALRQCLQIAPQHARAHNNLGLVLARLGRADESLAEFQRAGASEEQAVASLAYVQATFTSAPNHAASATPQAASSPVRSSVFQTTDPRNRVGPFGRDARLAHGIQPIE